MPGSHTDVPVPRYVLYGEADARSAWSVHLERMEDRCRERGWSIRPHMHSSFTQMMLITAGHGHMLIEGDRQPFAADTVLIVAPHSVHALDVGRDGRGWVITIETHYLDDVLKRAAALRPMMVHSGMVHLPPTVLEHLSPEIAGLGQELAGADRGSAIGVEIRLLAILLGLFRHWPDHDLAVAPGHGRGQLVNRYRALVEERFRAQPALDDMAAALGVSVSQLRLACTQIAGLSPLAILHQRLLAEARRYLAYTALPVARIADELGFSEASYFTRFFTRKAGETPTQWRHTHGERNGLGSGASEAA